MRHVLALAAVLACALAAGCVEAIVKRGDAALEVSRPAEAARHYEEALRKKPELADEPAFVARLAEARFGAHFEEGVRLAAAGQHEKAADRFALALEQDPDSLEAAAALAQAKADAAEARRQGAVRLFAENRLPEAIAELERAVALDPDNAAAREALDTYRREKTRRDAEAARLYDEGVALQREGRVAEAAARFEAAFELNPGHDPARAELTRARDTVVRAESLADEGARRLEAKELEPARRALAEALALWPHFGRARKLRERTRDALDRVVARTEASRMLAADGRWDEALAAAKEALAIHPSDAAARATLSDVRRRAAEEHTGAGREALAAGRLDVAALRFARALDYLPDHEHAVAGLARVDHARGRAAEAEDLPGVALLHYLNAAERAPDAEFEAAAASARGRVHERLRVRLVVGVTDALGAASAQASAVQVALARDLARAKPPWLDATVGVPPDHEAVYGAGIELVEFQVAASPVRSEPRTQAYTVGREVPNPSLPRLQNELAAERAELARLRIAHARPCIQCRGAGRIPCRWCGGAGFTPCTACGGRGRVACPGCGGAGTVPPGVLCPECKGKRTVRCDSCGGGGHIDCSSCGRFGHPAGWVECPRCDGHGLLGAVSAWDVERQEDEVERLERRVRNEPVTVIEETREEHAYSVLHHARTGHGRALLQLGRLGEEASAVCKTAEETVRHADTEVANPRPEVGVAVDPLDLPGETEVGDELARALAGRLARELVRGTADLRAGEMRSQAAAFEAEGRAVAAVDARVAAVVAEETADPARARAALDAFRRAPPDVAP